MGVVVATAAALAPLEFLADLVSIGTLFAFVVVSAAVWIMRVTDPQTPRPFRAPMVPLVSTMGILVNGGMMFFLGPENWMRLFIWLVLGLDDLLRLFASPFGPPLAAGRGGEPG